MRHFRELGLDKDISIWASGPSKDSIPKEDLEQIKKHTITIGLNFFILFKPDIRFWVDGRVSQWLDDRGVEDEILVTRPGAFQTPEEKKLNLRHKIEFWFDDNDESKKSYWRDGKFSLWMLMLMIRHYFPGKKIYLFGVDCNDNASVRYHKGKLVVKHLKGQQRHIEGLLQAFKAQYNNYPWFFQLIYNCNPNSKEKITNYLDYKEIYGRYQ